MEYVKDNLTTSIQYTPTKNVPISDSYSIFRNLQRRNWDENELARNPLKETLKLKQKLRYKDILFLKENMKFFILFVYYFFLFLLFLTHIIPIIFYMIAYEYQPLDNCTYNEFYSFALCILLVDRAIVEAKGDSSSASIGVIPTLINDLV